MKNNNNFGCGKDELLKLIVNKDSKDNMVIKCSSGLDDPNDVMYTMAASTTLMVEKMAKNMIPPEIAEDDEDYYFAIQSFKSQLYVILNKFLMDLMFEDTFIDYDDEE